MAGNLPRRDVRRGDQFVVQQLGVAARWDVRTPATPQPRDPDGIPVGPRGHRVPARRARWNRGDLGSSSSPRMDQLASKLPEAVAQTIDSTIGTRRSERGETIMTTYQTFPTSTTTFRGEILTDRDADGLRYSAPFRWRPRVATVTARRAANAPGVADASA